MDEPELDLDLLASSPLATDDSDVRNTSCEPSSSGSPEHSARLSVIRARGRLFSKSDKVERMTITLGDNQLDGRGRGSGVALYHRPQLGGIRIRSARVSTQDWLRGVLGALAEEAATSQQTRLALESIVIGGS